MVLGICEKEEPVLAVVLPDTAVLDNPIGVVLYGPIVFEEGSVEYPNGSFRCC